MRKPVALITGAGRRVNIAAGIARSLARAGWDLALTAWTPYDDRTFGTGQESEPQKLAEELLDFGATVLQTAWDLEKADSVAGLFQVLAEEMPPVSALILSHCECVESGILDTSVASLERHFAVNVCASLQLIQQFAAQIPEGGGSIIALTSDHTVGNVPYGATKGALDRIVIASARELAPLGIRANVLNPGPIDTGWMNDEIRTVLTQRQPSGRLGTPRDIGDFVRFLLSSEGAWANGQLLHVDGGFST